MKYLITESQFDNIVFKYLDNQDFVVIKMKNRLYYVNSEDDEYAQVRYHPKDRWCTIHYDLVDEVSKFFSLSSKDSKDIIGKWVENTLQMKVTGITRAALAANLFVQNA